ncbi:unnamed protein product [Mycena citricolor]|uniref:Uncharacterized protein n=1 Tax=Mycena citricolor TaxID=2018698 RepID=A0AAD2H3K2_9AGAR|nr:unnamed protein product [Mycena citricolor]CAK5269339.1 unnamed protein product [Mycena citricolor]
MSVTSKFTHVHRMHPTLCMALNLEAQEFPNQTPPKSRENVLRRNCYYAKAMCIERRGRESMRSQIGFNRGMRRRRATVIRPVHGKEGCWAVIVGSRRE